MTLDDVVKVLVAVSAAVVALGTLWRYVVRPTVRAGRATVETVHRIEKVVLFVEEQMRPNSGSTLRDSVDRIELTVGNHEARLVFVEEELEQLLG